MQGELQTRPGADSLGFLAVVADSHSQLPAGGSIRRLTPIQSGVRNSPLPRILQEVHLCVCVCVCEMKHWAGHVRVHGLWMARQRKPSVPRPQRHF